MRLSLDTHIFLWAVTDDRRLPAPLAESILDPRTEVFVSAACVWEITIKVGLGRLAVPDIALISEAIDASGFVELPISARHAAATGDLELLHRDPFDRLLLAQARTEGLTLATVDAEVRRYGGMFLP